MDDLKSLQKILQENRESRKGQTYPILPPQERDTLLKQYHPDYRADAYRPVRIGPNTGEKTVHEVADLLEGQSPLWSDSGVREIKPNPDHTVDVLVIGGGGAGCAGLPR